MVKVKIQDIAAEASLSNAELLEKAKKLGFDVKAGSSTISVEDAGVLVDYAITGVLPKTFKKPSAKSGIRMVKKKISKIKFVKPRVETVVAKEEEIETVVSEKVEISKEVTEVASSPIVREKAIIRNIDDIEDNRKIKNLEVKASEPEVESTPIVKEVKKRKGISVVSKKQKVVNQVRRQKVKLDL